VTRPGRSGLTAAGAPDVRLGLRANLAQFLLLAVVNFFVGGMAGTERTVTPLVGTEQFHLGALAVAAFVVVFGFTKAITNAVGGAVTARYTRKSILVAGWVIGLPVPFMHPADAGERARSWPPQRPRTASPRGRSSGPRSAQWLLACSPKTSTNHAM
jgi:hypothetical protein